VGQLGDMRLQIWSPWVIIRESAAKMLPIICIHPGGGAIQCYRALADVMPDDVPIYAIQSRAYGPNHLPLHQSIEEMAGDYLQEIAKNLGSQPYILIGYCFGCMVALEILEQAKRKNITHPSYFLMVDGQAPGVDDGLWDKENLIRKQLARVGAK